MAENIIKDVKLKIGTEAQFQDKLKDLPLNTLVGTTDPIQEGELDTSIITKLNKADNALPKPTNDTTGSAGQVLKKTANGSEWGDAPSGGGKLYAHALSIRLKDPNENSVLINSLIYSSINTAANNSATLVALLNGRHFPAWGYALNSNYFNPYCIQSLLTDGNHFRYTYFSPMSDTEFSTGDMSETQCTEIAIIDTVTEL